MNASPPRLTAEEMDTWDLLSESRKTDRAKMIAEITQLATRVAPTKVKIEVAPDILGDPNRQDVVILAPDGLRGRCELAGGGPKRWQNSFVLSWYFDLAPEFPRDMVIAPKFSPDRNPHHRRKATDVARGFANLMDILANRFWKIETDQALRPVGESD